MNAQVGVQKIYREEHARHDFWTGHHTESRPAAQVETERDEKDPRSRAHPEAEFARGASPMEGIKDGVIGGGYAGKRVWEKPWDFGITS